MDLNLPDALEDTVELEGKRIKLQIWDVAGQEHFRTITTGMLSYCLYDQVKWLNKEQQQILALQQQQQILIPQQQKLQLQLQPQQFPLQTHSWSQISYHKQYGFGIMNLKPGIMENLMKNAWQLVFGKYLQVLSKFLCSI
ncbi:hypothetical protein MKW98_028932 [Papaver atlanticum]|uniref:Uncharacterized protein n=1 Tax=Papaver atlanticum TaxID=357466 RepID=A0AAD4S2L5_9MAGN|nr:hypothetical protein MKW98_028932 [Papaver atlanticum]